MLSARSNENIIQSLFDGAKSVAAWIAGGAVVMVGACALSMSYFENTYGWEKVGPFMVVYLGGGLIAIGVILAGGRVFVRWYQSLESETTPVVRPSANQDIEYPDPGANSRWAQYILGVYHLRRTHYGLGVGFDAKTGQLVEMPFHDGSNAHLAVIGTTGTGKSKGALRPLIVEAAITGLYQVVILDKSGKDFSVLEGYPNIHIVRYDETTLPGIMRKVYQLILTRQKMLASHPLNPGCIDEIPLRERPFRVLTIFDEYSNAFELIETENPSEAKVVKSNAIRTVQEGRAVGVHFVPALQRATADMLNTTMRSQLKKLVLAVESSTDAKAAGVPGAETLDRGYAYLRRSDGVQHLRLYYPSNAELKSVLDSRLPEIREKHDGGNRPYIHDDISWLGEYRHGLPASESLLGGAGIDTETIYLGGTPGTPGGELLDSTGDIPWQDVGGQNGDAPPVLSKNHAPTAVLAAVSPLPPSTDPEQAARERMLAILATDDGAMHPSLNAPLAYVKATQIGKLGGLSDAECSDILALHIQSMTLVTQALSITGANLRFNASTEDSDEDDEDSSDILGNHADVKITMQEIIGAENGLLMFDEDDDVPDVLRRVTACQYRAGKMGLKSGLGIKTVASILFPNVKSPNNTLHKPMVRAIRDREGIAPLSASGYSTNSQV